MKLIHGQHGYTNTVSTGTLAAIGITAGGSAKILEIQKVAEELPIPMVFKVILWFILFGIAVLTLMLKLREWRYPEYVMSRRRDDDEED